LKNLITLILALLMVSSSYAQDWTSFADGHWEVQSVTISVTTTEEKDMFEQVRAWHNYQYRNAGDVLDAGEWASALLTGIEDTQTGNGVEYFDFCKRLWRKFIQAFVTTDAQRNSIDGGLTEGLAVVVPSAP